MKECEAVCMVPNCTKRRDYRELCQGHYRRLWKKGDVMAHVPLATRVQRGPRCSIPGCENEHKRIGFCGAHLWAFEHYGDPYGQAAEVTLDTIPVPNVAPDFGHYLAGLIDGEGHFAISRRNHAPRAWATRFTLSLRIDDQPIIETLHQVTALGRTDVHSGTHNLMARWNIASKAGCLGLVHVLDAYPLRAKKQRDLALWREATIAWTAKPEPSWEEMAALSAQLKEVRRI